MIALPGLAIECFRLGMRGSVSSSGSSRNRQMLKQNKYRTFPLRLIAFIGVIVPRRFRARFQQEWEAELEYREATLARWDRLDWRNKLKLLWLSICAVLDGLLLERQRLEGD